MENNNIESISNGNDDYTKSVEEINKIILDKLLEITGVPKEHECGFDYAWMTKQSWWNGMESQRYAERLEEIMKMIFKKSKSIKL